MPVTSSDFVYYGGFHVFSSAVFLSTVTPASTWLYYGGFHVFSRTSAIVSTSSGAAAVVTGRKLISPTGFHTALTVVRL